MSADMWVLSIEQSLLFLLIIGRWMLPKGDISHDQLSQLLFVYIGIASDIMEILILFDEEKVLRSDLMMYIILASWSFSLLQYTLVLTATKARKPRVFVSSNKPVDPEPDGVCACCYTELWSIIITVMMQDGPFLTIRMYIIVNYKSLNYTILFYTCKNFLVICLQIYRLVIVGINAKSQGKDEEDQTTSPKVNRDYKNKSGSKKGAFNRNASNTPPTPSRRVLRLVRSFSFSPRFIRKHKRHPAIRGTRSLTNSPYLKYRKWPSGIPPMPNGRAPHASLDSL